MGFNDHLVVSESTKLTSCHLVEVGEEGLPLWTWSYPILQTKLKGIVAKRCATLLKLDNSTQDSVNDACFFRYFHLDKQWFYFYVVNVDSPENPSMYRVKKMGMVVGAEDFNSVKYKIVGEVLLQGYLKTYDPSSVLQQFLSLVVDGTCCLPKKKMITLSDYNNFHPFKQHKLKEIINRFGLETILIYTAVNKKRRILVYHHDVEVLMEVVLSLPAFSDNINNLWDATYPWMDLNDEEIRLMDGLPFYIVGCTRTGIEKQSHVYDVFINIPAGEISVASHAKEAISMNKAHKDMALFMVKLASDQGVTEEDLVTAISRKTAEYADKLGLKS